MLHYQVESVKSLLFQCNIGLEKESLRVDSQGRMARTRHPFSEDDPHITRDFCENQTEVNTSVCSSAEEAVAEVARHTATIQRALAQLPEREYLWPFSNPPYIEDEDDIPVAVFEGARASKTTYRERLADNYGKYKMAFSGIHFNFSFGEELLRADFRESGESDFQEYKNRLYLELAEKAIAYGWVITAVTAASPLMDASFFTRGRKDEDAFVGMGSVRCSELGYWNHFAPILNYEDIVSYAASIRRYVDDGIISAPTELYYPIRLKPRGQNNLETLAREGVDHIELRMFDLNPLVAAGIDERDAFFAQLLLIFLASSPRLKLSARAQVMAVHNFKNAARYDLGSVKILLPNDSAYVLSAAGRTILGQMKKFFADADARVLETLSFQEEKFVNPSARYPSVVRRLYGDGFWRKGLQLAKERQAEL